MFTIQPKLAFVLVASFGIQSILSPPLLAQAEQARAAGKNTAVCMARPHDAVAQVSREKQNKPFFVLALEQSSAALKAKGFSVVDCKEAKLAQQGQVKRYRDEMCKLAATGNDAVQKQLERAFGESPAALCANAQMIAGSWQRGRSGEK